MVCFVYLSIKLVSLLMDSSFVTYELTVCLEAIVISHEITWKLFNFTRSLFSALLTLLGSLCYSSHTATIRH